MPRARLRAQQLATRKAKALYEIAKATRELAEIAAEEYEEVNYPKDLATVEGEIKLAESDLTRSEDRVDWAKRMFEKGYVSQATKVSEELTHREGPIRTRAGTKQEGKCLVDYTKGKTIKELKSEVEKARSDERAKQASWIWRRLQEIELERQLGLKTN